MFRNYALKTFLYMKTLKYIYLENRVLRESERDSLSIVSTFAWKVNIMKFCISFD